MATGRNAPCPCGSGRKYKTCCLAGCISAHAPRPTVPPRRKPPSGARAAHEQGRSLLHDGRLQEALAALQQALELHPDFPEALNDLGVCSAALGQYPQAIVHYARSLELCPENPLAFSNMGSALQALGRTDEAIASQRVALSLDVAFGQAWVNLSQSLYAARRYEEAVEASARALELSPDFAVVALNGASALHRLGCFAEAVTLLRQAAALHPNDPRYPLNLAESLREQGLIDDSINALQRALQIQPDFPAAYSNLLHTHALTRNITAAEELHLARAWEIALIPEPQRHHAKLLRTTPGAFPRSPRAGRRLRLGIVSSELGAHAVAEFLHPLLAHFDRTRIHITLFPTAGHFNGRADDLRTLADNIVPLTGLPDDPATQRIRDQAIDVLLDTSGHTANNRLGLFARRAAPVQCTYIGYWSTTGLTEMDWFLSDPDAPRDAQAAFSEGLWRLPRIAVAYRGDHALNHTLWTPSPDGTLRLGSFNRLFKIREETIALWSHVLRAIPHSRLLLEDENTRPAETHTRIRSLLEQNGIASSRLSFIPYEHGHERHMLLYNQLDIALDTLPFNSGTTAFDALWMGVPLVALEGTWIGGRMGASILRSLGRPEWIASHPTQLAGIIEKIAKNPPPRHDLRDQMAASPLCDAAALATALAEAFESMYDQWWNRQHGSPLGTTGQPTSTHIPHVPQHATLT